MSDRLTSLEQLRMAAERSKALSAQVAAAAADAIGEMEEGLSGKQDKLTGTQGQIVGFDAAGNAVAQDAPSSGVTMTEVNEAISAAITGAMEASY